MSNIVTTINILLNDTRIDVNVPDEFGSTAFHEVVRSDLIELVQPLVDKGADIHAKNNYDSTALAFAETQYNTSSNNETIIFLLRNGATPSAKLLAQLTPKQAKAMDEYKTYKTSLANHVQEYTGMAQVAANIVAQYILEPHPQRTYVPKQLYTADELAFRAWLARKAQTENAALRLKKLKIEQHVDPSIKSLEEDDTSNNAETGTRTGAGAGIGN